MSPVTRRRCKTCIVSCMHWRSNSHPRKTHSDNPQLWRTPAHCPSCKRQYRHMSTRPCKPYWHCRPPDRRGHGYTRQQSPERHYKRGKSRCTRFRSKRHRCKTCSRIRCPCCTTCHSTFYTSRDRRICCCRQRSTSYQLARVDG